MRPYPDVETVGRFIHSALLDQPPAAGLRSSIGSGEPGIDGDGL